MRVARVRALCLAGVIAATGNACYAWEIRGGLTPEAAVAGTAVPPRASDVRVRRSGRARVVLTLRGGERVPLRGPWISADSVGGVLMRGGGVVAYPLDAVVDAETHERRFSEVRTGLAILAGFGVLFVLGGGI